MAGTVARAARASQLGIPGRVKSPPAFGPVRAQSVLRARPHSPGRRVRRPEVRPNPLPSSEGWCPADGRRRIDGNQPERRSGTVDDVMSCPRLHEYQISGFHAQSVCANPGLPYSSDEYEQLIRVRVDLLADLAIRRQRHHGDLLVDPSVDGVHKRVVMRASARMLTRVASSVSKTGASICAS